MVDNLFASVDNLFASVTASAGLELRLNERLLCLNLGSLETADGFLLFRSDPALVAKR